MKKLAFILASFLFLQIQLQGQAYPKFTALVGGKEGGKIVRGSFLVQEGVEGSRFITGNHWEPLPIDSFSILVQRDSTILIRVDVSGQYFGANLKEQLKRIQRNDRILIYNIYGNEFDKVPILIRPIEFVIE